MSKDICMGCKAKKKLTAFNYAGFIVNAGLFHAYPERINKGKLKGSQETHFICVDCVNKLTITCKVHGTLDGKFSMGVPPSCKLCCEEKIEVEREATRQKYWQDAAPDLVDNQRLKLIYLRGALAYQLMKADGDISQSELDSVKEVAEWTCDTSIEADTFYKGALNVKKKSLKLNILLDLCHQLKNKKQNINTVKFLFKISASDDSLDKAEYNFIRKVSLIFKLNIPEFKNLASSLNVETSNAKQDQIIKVTGDVLTAAGKGVILVGGFLVKLLGEIIEAGNVSTGNNVKKSLPKSNANKKANSSKSSNRKKIWVSRDRKSCCTCEYWAGSREPFGNSIRGINYFDSNDRGKCLNNESPFRNSPPLHIHHRCSEWEVWRVLL